MSNARMEPADAWETPEEFFGTNTPTRRRLCLTTYWCRLCGEKHTAENYITLRDKDSLNFRERLQELLPDQSSATEMIDTHSAHFHVSRGDLPELLLQAAESGLKDVDNTLEHEVTDEQTYTCDRCGGTFSGIADLRRHEGLDPVTAQITGTPECQAWRDQSAT